MLKLILMCLLVGVLGAMSPMARAVPLLVDYVLPTTDCGGGAIPAGAILELEIYVSAGSIPAQDVNCPPAGSPVDAVPESVSAVIQESSPDGTAELDLIGGVTYFFRGRVRTASGWSNLSNQITRLVPEAPPGAPVLRFTIQF